MISGGGSEAAGPRRVVVDFVAAGTSLSRVVIPTSVASESHAAQKEKVDFSESTMRFAARRKRKSLRMQPTCTVWFFSAAAVRQLAATG